MIVVNNVHKRYQTDHGVGKWVLRGASFTIPANTNVGLIGKNGAGKSTLLRLIGGVDQPTRGQIERHCNVSWPMGFGGGLQGSLTGRQNSKFVCRIYGHESSIPERLAFIQEFSEIGDIFDEPVKTYSSGMQARLKFAMSLAFDFDVYISDELTSVGDAAFKKKAKSAFRDLAGRAGLIMVSHTEKTLKDFCSAGIWLNDGNAYWFDSIDDALQAYNESEPVSDGGKNVSFPKNQERIINAKNIIKKGLAGETGFVDEEDMSLFKRQSNKMGIKIMPERQIIKKGYRLNKGAIPVLKIIRSDGSDRQIDLFDLNSQCVKVEI